jgi:hypothetical protein
MSQQTMPAHPDTETAGNPIKNHRRDKSRPTPGEKRDDCRGMRDD